MNQNKRFTAIDTAPRHTNIHASCTVENICDIQSCKNRAQNTLSYLPVQVNLILSGGSFFRSGLIPASAAGRPRDFGPNVLERPADVESVRPLPLQSGAAGGESNPRSADQRVVFSDALSPLQVYSNVSRASGGLVVEVGKAAAAQALQLLQLAANNSKVMREARVGRGRWVDWSVLYVVVVE